MDFRVEDRNGTLSLYHVYFWLRLDESHLFSTSFSGGVSIEVSHSIFCDCKRQKLSNCLLKWWFCLITSDEIHYQILLWFFEVVITSNFKPTTGFALDQLFLGLKNLQQIRTKFLRQFARFRSVRLSEFYCRLWTSFLVAWVVNISCHIKFISIKIYLPCHASILANSSLI